MLGAVVLEISHSGFVYLKKKDIDTLNDQFQANYYDFENQIGR